MIEIYVPVVVRQRDALSKEFSRGRPPYSSRFDTKRHELDPTSRKLFTPLDGLIPRRTLVGLTMLIMIMHMYCRMHDDHVHARMHHMRARTRRRPCGG